MSTIIANRYLLQDKIGAGGMGEVYRAFDQLTQRTIALKRVTTPDSKLFFNSRTTNDNFLLAIAQEFKILSSLRHPNIIQVLDYGFTSDKTPFFTMSYLQQAKTVLDSGKFLSIGGKIQLILQSLNAINYLHRNHILHRDLKPENILVNDEFSLTVLDFGLSARAKETEEAVGTLQYMAPETLQQGLATPVSDLYSLGVIAYELFVGTSPYDVENPTQLIADILHKEAVLSSIENNDLQELLEQWLQKDPSKRPQSAEELIDKLKPHLDNEQLSDFDQIQESFLQSARFVGRENEFSQLTEALNQAKVGNGSAWLIGGESGVGKSRLIDELRTVALVEGATVVRSVGVQGSGQSFHLWRDVMRRLILNVSVSNIEAGIIAELVPNIRHILPDQEIVSAPPINAALAQDRLIQTIVDIIKRQDGLTVLLLEDLHWVDTSLKVIERLLGAVSESSLVIVGSYRNDERPDLPEQLAEMTVLPLDRFDRDVIQNLSISMIGDAGKTDELTSFLERETKGNAFFVVEAMRALAEEAGNISRIGTVTLPEHIVTGGMRAALERRINNIPKQMQSLIKLSAVIGLEVTPELLYEVESPKFVDEWVTRCVNSAILENRDERLHFSHDKLRSITIDNLSSDEFKSYNRQAAQALEGYHADPTPYAGILSTHWQNAENESKATHYAGTACENMMAIANYTEAYKYGTRTLDSSSITKEKRLRMTKIVGEARHYMGQPDDAIAMYKDALEMAKDAEDDDMMSEILIGLANVAVSRGEFDAYEDYIRQSFARAKGKKARAYGNLFLGTIYRMKEDHVEADKFTGEALRLFRELDEKFPIMGILNDRSVWENQFGKFEIANEHIIECLGLARELGNQRSISIVLCNMAYIGFNLGTYATSVQHAREALQIAENIGDSHNEIVSLNRLGEAYAHLGEFEHTKTYFNKLIPMAERLNRKDILIQTLSTAIMIAIIENDLVTLEMLIDKLRSIEDVAREWLQSFIALTLGDYYVFKEDYSQAKSHYEESLALITKLREPWRIARTKIKFAHALIKLEDKDQAHAMLREALSELREIKAYSYLLSGLIELGYIYHLNGQSEQAAQWLGLIANHPALSAFETDVTIAWLADALTRSMGKKMINDKMSDGESQDLLTVIDEVLAPAN